MSLCVIINFHVVFFLLKAHKSTWGRLLCSQHSTLCIRELDKLNLMWRFDFKLNPIFTSGPSLFLKNTIHFKSVPK